TNLYTALNDLSLPFRYLTSKLTLHNIPTHTQILASNRNDWNMSARLTLTLEPLHLVGLQRHMHYYHPQRQVSTSHTKRQFSDNPSKNNNIKIGLIVGFTLAAFLAIVFTEGNIIGIIIIIITIITKLKGGILDTSHLVAEVRDIQIRALLLLPLTMLRLKINRQMDSKGGQMDLPPLASFPFISNWQQCL
ncbi:hypothetical protein LB507_009588, partial [Fusarium sp. FIESC RH6]